MAEDTPIEPEAVEDDSGELQKPEPETGGSLRKKLTEALARVKELEASKDTEVGELSASLMDLAYQDLGLDPERGIGKAAALMYDGPAGGLAEYVEAEFDYVGPENPMVHTIRAEHARLEEVDATAGSVAEPTGDQILAKAEAAGDWSTTMQLKGEQVAALFRQ